MLVKPALALSLLLISAITTAEVSNPRSVSYPVAGATIAGTPSAQDKATWLKLVDFFPSQYLQSIHLFTITSDGIDGDLASVFSIDGDNRFFELQIDPLDLLTKDGQLINNIDIYQTLIHEYFHIVSLNASQFTSKQSHRSGLKISEGKLASASYLNQFYRKFWHHLKATANKHESYADDPEALEELASQLYQKYPDSFVNEYAASNPVEDIAETFSYFVLQNKPSADLVKNQKIRFFYQFPELVKMRQHFRLHLELSKQ